MAKRMLIDAAHPEETRVVVTSGTRLEEFDFESSTKKQVKGNIYLAKVTRVEPSLQAAFVDYGGNRHGFLAFSEIHPDYYRIPVSDRPAANGVDPSHDHAADNHHEDEAVPIAAVLPEQVSVPDSGGADDDGPEDNSENNTSVWPGDAVTSELPPLVEPAPLATSELGEVEPFSDETSTRAPVVPQQEPEEQPASAAAEPQEDAASIEGAAAGKAGHHPGYADAGHADAGHADGGQADAGHADAGHADAGHADAGHADGGQADAGHADAGHADESRAEAQGEPAGDPTAETVPETSPAPETLALRSAEESVLAVEVDEYTVAAEMEASGAASAEMPTEVVSDDYTNEAAETSGEPSHNSVDLEAGDVEAGEVQTVETLGGDEAEETEEEADAARRRYHHSSRHYKIQEVIKRRQIMLVQVAKEERGNKGAALTTYLSLAGRYCVLMPNTNRGGGVSRKITSIADRRRLKDIVEELDIPEGMGVIVRTAGAERSKAEIKRDYEYLLRLWNEIRDLTLQSTAPALIYEEGDLIKRSIRDLYTRDIDDVLVEGEEGYKVAKGFMRTLMPSHAKRVQPYRDPQIGLFHRFQIESQIDAIHSPVAQLKSGGYVVINQTEALVAIDVNSGRSTRERNIEETALRTNIEAADEIARQLRLRDLAGLIVIDFIDMEEHRNQIAVERRLKEALRNDRARIQVGRISPFGLLEMSRQRLRPSLAEASTQPCPHCAGTGFIRSVESTALYVLRSIEEEGIRRRSAEICIYVPTNVALYILNQKRDSLAQIELRNALRVTVAQDDSLIPPNFRLERLRQYGVGEVPPLPTIQAPTLPEEPEEDEEDEALDMTEAGADGAVQTAGGEAGGGEAGSGEAGSGEAGSGEADSEDDRGRRRRRRRRRRPDEAREVHAAESTGEAEAVAETADEERPEREGDGERRHRRRGRRGRIRTPRRDGQTEAETGDQPAAETIEIVEGAPLEAVSFESESERQGETPSWQAETGVETASLAPLAGEIGASEHAAEPHLNAAEDAPTAEAEAGVPFTSEAERELETVEHGIAAEASEPPAAAEIEAGVAIDDRQLRAEDASAPEPVPEPLPVPEPVPVPEPEPAASPQRNDDVLTVTEKPANPRRGWWQRLIQS
ncbi:MAG: Rne/Rng family ribonuclease [Alphaproteobacteria bacterium]|nr:Rne/Rng family ribonuclease [Alphaproteobacteria bacterium]